MIADFTAWLNRSVAWQYLFVMCAAIVIVDAFYSLSLNQLIGYFRFIPEMCKQGDEECFEAMRILNWILKESPWFILIGTLLPFAFLEEVLFRWIPLGLTTWWLGVRNVLLFVVIPVSLVFGWIHYLEFDARSLLSALLLQSVGGIVLSIIYLKAGGAYKRHSRALLTSTFAHAAFNISIAFAARLFPGLFI